MNLNASHAGKLDGERRGWGGEKGVGGERGAEYSYCTCCVTNVFPPEMSFKEKRGGSLSHNSKRYIPCSSYYHLHHNTSIVSSQ